MNNQQTVVVPTNNVEGNITSCKLENQLIKTYRPKVYSVQEINTYATYDVCSKNIVAQYDIPSITAFGGMLGVLIGVVLVTAIMAMSSSPYDF